MPEPVAVSNGSVRTWSTDRIRVLTTIGVRPRDGMRRISRSTRSRVGAATVWRRLGLAGAWTSTASDSSCGPTETGQVGLFPEHAATLPWLRDRIDAAPERPDVLNLFAYTGLTTARARHEPVQTSSMSMPLGPPSSGHAGTRRGTASRIDRSAGWSMTHVRSSPGRSVAVAAITASCSTHRHTGTGMSGKAWRLSRDLEPLLDDVRRLLVPGAFILLTAHAADLDPGRLGGYLGEAAEVGDLVITATSGATLQLGAYARLGRAS